MALSLRSHPRSLTLVSWALVIGVSLTAALLATLIHLQLDRDALEEQRRLEAAVRDVSRDIHESLLEQSTESLERIASQPVGALTGWFAAGQRDAFVRLPFHVTDGRLTFPRARAAVAPSQSRRPDLGERLERAVHRAQQAALGDDRVLAERTYRMLFEERLPPQALAESALRFASFLADEPGSIDEALTWCRRAARAAIDAELPDVRLFAELRQVELLAKSGRHGDAASRIATALAIARDPEAFFTAGPAGSFVIERLESALEDPDLLRAWPEHVSLEQLRGELDALEEEALLAAQYGEDVFAAANEVREEGQRWLSLAPPLWIAYRPSREGDSRGIVGFLAASGRVEGLWRDALNRLQAGLRAPFALEAGSGEALAKSNDWQPTSQATIVLDRPIGDRDLRLSVDLRSLLATARSSRAIAYGSFALLALLAISAGGIALRKGIQRQLALAGARSRFVTEVSHDLRTPLTQIRLFSDILREGYQRHPEDVEQSLEIIAREVDELERLIDNVLELARSEEGEDDRTAKPLDIGRAVKTIAEKQRPYLERRGFRLEVIVETGLPRVLLDARHFEQATGNLISNAVKYSQDRKEIEIRCTAEGRGVRLTIADRGQGLPAESERLFDRFARGDDPRQAHVGGVGLGLSIVRQIATRHGGHITARPREGGGSEFTLWFPAIGIEA